MILPHSTPFDAMNEQLYFREMVAEMRPLYALGQTHNQTHQNVDRESYLGAESGMNTSALGLGK